MQNGHVGYSLIADDTNADDGSSLGHVIFCPTCGNEVATVYVNFLPPMEPQPGSRLKILADTASYALAELNKKKSSRPPTKPTKVKAIATK